MEINTKARFVTRGYGKCLALTILLLQLSIIASAQIKSGEGYFSQTYSKELTEYKVKEFIVSDVLHVPEKEIIAVEINAITAAKSGELTTTIFDCNALKKNGIVLAFWNERINEFNTKYQGYAFKHIELEKAKELLDNLDKVIDENGTALSADNNSDFLNNIVYKWQDITFIFYRNDFGFNIVRVFWNGFDSEWSQSNIKLTKKRFDKFFFPKKK